jgi:hypothetical protein
MKHSSLYFAQAYGEGAYSDGLYACTAEQEANGTCTTVAGSTGDTGSGGGLADTGIAVLVIVTLACLIIFVALVVRIWRRPKLVPQEVEEEQQQEQEQH